MIDSEGNLSFTPELITLVEQVLSAYEAANGPLESDLQRGLAISFVLGYLHCNLDAIWDELATAPHFAAQHPREMFADCQGRTPHMTSEDVKRLRNVLMRYGWVEED
ncbi:MAG: hypothetical protein GXY52_04860 [Chloroflexi bacterium]|nr:hypothetical protein [Chloroflexota bacterium]